MKNMAEKGKIVAKKCDFGGKNRVIGFKKYEPATKLERQNGAKCRFCT